MAKDTKFGADVAERIGIGFDLPKTETIDLVHVFETLRKRRSR
jgi:hypothetical protein